MSAARQSSELLSDADWNALEALLEEFEAAWSAEARPDIAAFAARAGEAWRAEAVRELIHADVEFRTRSGAVPEPGDYAALLPQFTVAAEAVDSALRKWTSLHAGAPVKIGRYEVRGKAGKGATATVYRAFDPVLEREVAVKVPLEALFAVPESRSRVLREARSVARLHHPAIVAVHETGEDADGTPWIVSDFIAGPPLDKVLRDSPPPRDTAVRWVLRLAEALEYAHQCGVIHRDVKPANVLMDADGQPVLTDFGLALLDDAAATLTRAGDVLGTPAYMSPEQARGEGHAADVRTDVYSLGVMLYEMLCRRRPFEGTGTTVINQLLHEDPLPPRRLDAGIPASLETVCLTAMAREPRRRYQTMALFAADLRHYLNNEPIAARRTGPAGRAWLWARRRPALAGTIAAALAAVVATAAIAYVRIAHERDAARDSLCRSLLREARAERLARRSGARDRVFAALREAAASGAASLNMEEVREEAVDCLGDFAVLAPQEAVPPKNVFFVSVAASADSTTVAAGATDGAVRFYDSATGRERASHKAHAHGVFAVAFSRDGKWFASADGHGGVRLWSPRDGGWSVVRELETAKSEDAGVVGAISLGFPAGDLLMACPKGAKSLSLWRLSDGTPVAPPETGSVFRAAVSPDGTQAAALLYNTAIVIWSTGAEWKEIARSETGLSTAVDLLFVPGDNQPVCVQQRAVSLLKPGTLARDADWQTDRLFSASASPDGRWIALPGHNSDLVRLRARGSSSEAAALDQPGDPHSTCFTPDGRLLVTQSATSLRFWKLHPPEKPHTFYHDGAVNDLVWLSAEKLASTSADGTLRLHDLSSGLTTVRRGFHGVTDALALSGDGQLLLVSDRTTLYALNAADLSADSPPVLSVRHTQDAINSIALSRDRTRLYAAGDFRVDAWRCVLGSLAAPQPPVSAQRGGSLRLTHADTRLWWVDEHASVHCRDLSSDQPIETGGLRAGFSDSLDFSADEERFYSSSADGIRVSASAAPLPKDSGLPTGDYSRICLSDDDRLLAASERRVSLLDLTTNSRVARLPAAEARPEAMRFSPDGRHLALGTSHGLLEVWEVAALLRALDGLEH